MTGNDRLEVDVLVAGAGVGGISAALGAARQGAKVLLVDAQDRLGGTGVNSPLGLLCGFHNRRRKEPVNTGVLQEFHPQAYTPAGIRSHYSPVYDHDELAANYERLVEAEPTLKVFRSTRVTEASVSGGRITSVMLEGQHCGTVQAKVFIDSTADGNLSALAGAGFQKGREEDSAMQPATLTFILTDIDWSQFDPDDPWLVCDTRARLEDVWKQLGPYFTELHEQGGTDNARKDVLCFQLPDGKRLAFNQTRLLGVDPTDEEAVRVATETGHRQIHEFFSAVSRHPALEHARIESISPMLGIREGRRVIGDYILTMEDCLGEARFDDMVAACNYDLDIHNPKGDGAVMKPIPNSGYYHIPWRCLYSADLSNLALASRCISGTHEAHSSYRVMCPLGSIGQAAGTAAALMIRKGISRLREVEAAEIRYLLEEKDCFVEGETKAP